MISSEVFVQQFDAMVCDVKASEGIAFKKYMRSYLENGDYDTFITLYTGYINICIKRRQNCFAEEVCPYELEDSLKREEGLRLKDVMTKWQNNNKEELLKVRDRLIEGMENFFTIQGKEVPHGFKECMLKVGVALIYSGMRYDEYVERNWDAISSMFCLGYKGHIDDKIEEKYREVFYKANEFVKAYNISIPYYYVLAWDIWKSGNENTTYYEHNQKRIRKVLSFLPEAYLDILAGKRFEPTKRRYVKGDENSMIKRIESIDLQSYFPSFIRQRPRYEKCSDSFHMEKSRHEFYHPLHMFMVPCTYLYKDLDVDLFVHGLYEKIKNEKLMEQLGVFVCEPDEDVSELTQLADDGKFENVDVPRVKELQGKIKKIHMTTPQLLAEHKMPKDGIRKFQEAGFAKKTYYDLKRADFLEQEHPTPAKDTLIAVACVLGLDISKTKELLSSCGYIFSPSSRRDIMIEHLIKCEINDISEISTKLELLGMKGIHGKKRGKQL